MVPLSSRFHTTDEGQGLAQLGIDDTTLRYGSLAKSDGDDGHCSTMNTRN